MTPQVSFYELRLHLYKNIENLKNTGVIDPKMIPLLEEMKRTIDDMIGQIKDFQDQVKGVSNN